MPRKQIKPIVLDENGSSYVRSTNFAKVFGRDHNDLLKRIRRIRRKDQGNLTRFSPISYQDSYGRSQPEFLISEEGFHLLTQNYQKFPQKYEGQIRHIKRYKILFNQANKKELDIIKPSNWWAFGQPKYRMEEAFPGSIPGEVYANALYYFAPQTGIAADVMAGSGMLRKVYNDRNRWQKDLNFDLDIRLYDLYPKEPFASHHQIRQHDATERLPDRADWIFFDPPYFGQCSHLYQGELATTEDYAKYLEVLRSVIIAMSDSLTPTGKLCIFITPYMSFNGEKQHHDTPLHVRKVGTQAGLSLQQRVYVSRGEQQRPYAGKINIKAKRLRRMISDVCELLVFTKEA